MPVNDGWNKWGVYFSTCLVVQGQLLRIFYHYSRMPLMNQASSFFCLFFLPFFKKRFLKFIYSWETHRGRDTGRGRSRLHAGSPMWDSIPGLQDRTLSQRQTLNHWATQASQFLCHFYCGIFFLEIDWWLCLKACVYIPNRKKAKCKGTFLLAFCSYAA